MDKWDRSIVLAIRILLAAKPYELLASSNMSVFQSQWFNLLFVCNGNGFPFVSILLLL